jgi:hypothetical protein
VPVGASLEDVGAKERKLGLNDPVSKNVDAPIELVVARS